ncbi:MAG: ABC transporter substrate-binding protein, partial [Bradyrhizobium sp.]
WGEAILHGTELAAEDFNKDGGLDVGGKRYPIRVIAYDTKYKANEALSAANRLISEDNVKFILGPVGAAEAYATQDITTAKKVITLVFAWSPRVLGPKLPFQFRVSTSTDEFAPPQIRWIGQKIKLKTVGGLFPNDEYGQQSSKQVIDEYAKTGTTAFVELFERDRVDFVPLLTRLIGRGIEAVELDGNSPTTAGLIVKQARSLGFTGPFVRSGGPAEREILQVAGKAAAEGMYLHSPVNPIDPGILAFEARHKKKYGSDMSGFMPSFYDGARMLFEAIQKAGTIEDTEKVAKALEGINHFQGLQGELGWSSGNYGIPRQINAPFYIVQIKDGRTVPVARCTYAECKDMN